MKSSEPSPDNCFQQIQTKLLIDSYLHWTGEDLIKSGSDCGRTDAERLFRAPFVVVSHNSESDPKLTYGNETALKLWQLTWEELVGMPSRLTAEPMAREEREKLLEDAELRGYSKNYQGVRISSTGRRFRIEGATVWNVVDSREIKVGQAAVFSKWTFL